MKRMLATLSAAAVGAIVLSAPARAQSEVTRYVRYDQGGTISWGVLENETIHQLSDAPYLGGTRTGSSAALSSVKLKAPVDPTLGLMTALNFRSHLGNARPAPYPGFFLISPHSIIGPDEAIIVHPESRNLHYEAEAVIVIGKEARNVPVERAHEYIFGVTAGNDVSERGWQFADEQWSRAKSTDTFNALGPVLVAGLDPTNVWITGRLNGEQRQHENTNDMLFSFPEMVSYISRYITLKPGDIIWSGTPQQTQAMSPGDVYEVEVGGVGVLRNPVVAAASAATVP